MQDEYIKERDIQQSVDDEDIVIVNIDQSVKANDPVAPSGPPPNPVSIGRFPASDSTDIGSVIDDYLSRVPKTTPIEPADGYAIRKILADKGIHTV